MLADDTWSNYFYLPASTCMYELKDLGPIYTQFKHLSLEIPSQVVSWDKLPSTITEGIYGFVATFAPKQLFLFWFNTYILF